MKIRLIVTAMILAALGAPAADRQQLVFSEQSRIGQLWANLSLSYLRVDEPYLPMVVGVQNNGDDTITLERSSFRLLGPDGARYPMATLKEVRSDYGKYGLDHRAASASGIPVDLWYRQRRLRESNFFPDINSSRRGTVIDKVVLRRGDGMADLVYFPRPVGLRVGAPFALEVHPDGWEAPMRLRLRMN